MAPEILPTSGSNSIETEHLRLVRQARLLEPLTERLLQEAGIGHGMRVLDLGCGMGDVAMLAARLVGPSGRVVGVDRDALVLAHASRRAEAAGFENIGFFQSDVADLPASQPFDAAVGRLILAFVPDPVAVLKALCTLVRSGGVLAFQEVSLANTLAQTAHLPLRKEAWSLIQDTLSQRAPASTMSSSSIATSKRRVCRRRRFETNCCSATPGDPELLLDLLSAMWPRVGDVEMARDKLGDFSTLAAVLTPTRRQQFVRGLPRRCERTLAATLTGWQSCASQFEVTWLPANPKTGATGTQEKRSPILSQAS